jgi:hypothetical protein
LGAGFQFRLGRARLAQFARPENGMFLPETGHVAA